MRSRIVGLLAFAVAITAHSSVQAQPIQYLFADSNNNFTNAFTIPAIGQTVEVRVFLNDTGAASTWFTGPNSQNNGTTQFDPTATNNLNTNGLRQTGFQVTSSLPGVARVNSSAQVTPNTTTPNGVGAGTGFNFFNPNAPQNGSFAFVDPAAGIVQATASVLGGTTGLQVTTGRLFIGSMIFTGVAGGVTTLSFSDNSPQLQQNVLANEPPFNPPFPAVSNGGAVLDAVTVPPGSTIPGLFSTNPQTMFQTATITVVPEPTSLIFGGLGLAGFGFVRRYRRR